MKITSRVSAEELREKYDMLIGWGAAKNEYMRKYNPCLFPLDYMIDINKELEGKIICGMKISNVDILEKLANDHVCFIIFPNIEQAVDQKASKYVKDYDTVVSALVDVGGRCYYSESGEDLLFMQMIDKLNLQDPTYLDIGVCHPVIRNNTYMLYEHGYKKGVLVEPNPDMCKLIKEYRPDNTLLNMGACADESQLLRYYTSSIPSIIGHNTFNEAEAKICGFTKYLDIPVDNINHIIEIYCSGMLDILDVDAEGMDYSLISALDTERYGIKMICVETAICGNDLVDEVLEEKGYVHFASTRNNGIYLAKKLLTGKY